MDRTVEDEGFYITLPSNSSLNVFKNNTSSSFRVDLAQHINLEGSWQVALTEISYPYTWHNAPRNLAYFEWRKKGEETFYRHNIGCGHFKDLNQLKTEIDGHLRKIRSDIYLFMNSVENRLVYQAGGQYHLRFYPPLSYMLGVVSGEWIVFDTRRAPYPMDLKSGFYQLYCYSDVVASQIVGDAYAPLLRTVRVEGKFGDIITHTFSPLDYLPVSKRHIENIHIEIKTDRNVPVDFTYGKTIVRLHFRPVISRHVMK